MLKRREATELLIRFLKFGGLSGLGWIADMSILLCLVRLLGMAPFVANMISSATAAVGVFLLSREIVFTKADGRVGLRVAFYLAYTSSVILIASLGVAAIVAWLGPFAAANGVVLSGLAVTASAKVIVTPPQLVLSFLMSRFLSERDMKRRETVHG